VRTYLKEEGLKHGAITATLASGLLATWPAYVGAAEHDSSALVLAMAPFLAATVAIQFMWRSRHSRWLFVPAEPPIWLRVALAAVPAFVFFVLFDAKLVLALLLAGPPE
jgi:hypothetical protein